MRTIAAAAVLLCLSAGAQAEELCSSGNARSGGLQITLLVSKKDHAPPVVTYMHVTAPNPEKSHSLSVHYNPTDAGLGTPTRAEVDIFFKVPDPERAEPERIEWRLGSGPWFNPGTWGTVRPAYGNPKDGSAMVSHTLAQGRIHPYRTELLDALVPGVRWEFRRLDRQGREIGSGAVDYPPARVIAGLYERARANGVGGLRPCRHDGPPIVAPPAPPPPMRIARPVPDRPPAPREPVSLDARACALFRSDEKRIAETKPQSGRRTKLIEQSVDCTGRSVKQVYEMDSFKKGDKADFRAHLQSTSDRMWCSSPMFRALVGRGWTFRMEFKEVGDPSVIGATTRKCGRTGKGRAAP